MITDFALDLRLARRKSGLSQQEIACLLDSSQSTYSSLEGGAVRPTLHQLCQLSLIYGRSFHSLFEQIVADVKPGLLKRLKALPTRKRRYVTMFNRDSAIRRMKQRLEAANQPYDHT